MWTEHTSQMLLRLSDQRKCHWTSSDWVATRQSSKNCWKLSSPLHRWEWQLVPGEHNPQNYSRLHSPGTYFTLWFLVCKIFVTCRDALCMMFSRLAADIPQNFRDFWSTSETKIASVTKIRQGYGQWVWIAPRAYVILADHLLYLWLVFWSCSSNSHYYYGFQNDRINRKWDRYWLSILLWSCPREVNVGNQFMARSLKMRTSSFCTRARVCSLWPTLDPIPMVSL